VDALRAKHFLIEARLARDAVPSPESYPFNLPALRTFDRLTFHPKVTFLVGENGAGKSTLLEALAVGIGLNAEGGSRNFNFDTRASHSDLYKYLVLRRGIKRPRDSFFFRAESYFNLATEIERLDREPFGGAIAAAYGERPLHEQSHGESFLALVENRFFGQGLYLLDEPEAALSPTRQMTLLSVLHDLVVGGSQFIIATHSPILMAYPDAHIFSLDDGLKRMKYEETEHFKVTTNFLLRTEQMLSILMGKTPAKDDTV
jgi:predicted ATPase